MSTNCERRRDLGAVQFAEATSSYSTSAVSCCAHSEQLNMSRSQPGVPVRAMSYSRIARPQLGHAGVLPTGCSDDLNRLNWGITPLLALPTNSPQWNLFRDWFCHDLREHLAGAHVRFGSKADSAILKAELTQSMYVLLSEKNARCYGLWVLSWRSAAKSLLLALFWHY